MTMNRIYVAIIPALLLAVAPGCDRKAADRSTLLWKVVTMRPRTMTFSAVLPLRGNADTREGATLAARVSGTLDDIMVGEGDMVKKDTPLFQVDRVNLEHDVKSQLHKLDVTRAEQRIADINLRTAGTVLEKALVDYNRAVRLHEVKAISADAFERSKLVWEEAADNVRKAEAQANYARSRLSQEESALRIAQKKLDDSLITSPFAGVVTQKLKDAKEYVSAGEKIIRVENPELLELVADISDLYYPRVIPGETRISVESNGKCYLLPVSFRSPRVDSLSRTFTIKVNLPPEGKFVSGRLYDFGLLLRTEQGVGVPNEAVLSRAGEKRIVFAVSPEGIAEEVPVKTGIVDGKWTRILNPEVLQGRRVVMEGQSFLEPGVKVEEAR